MTMTRVPAPPEEALASTAGDCAADAVHVPTGSLWRASWALLCCLELLSCKQCQARDNAEAAYGHGAITRRSATDAAISW